MPRKPRLHVPGGIYHVILRGNNRQAIFDTPADRFDFEQLLAGGLKRYSCRVHAYCWMTNHVHLAVQVGEKPLSGLMGWVASQYARRFNVRMGRSGHLFERRHIAILIDHDTYLLSLVRYIHRNPIEAKLVSSACDYQWSSHRDFVGHCRHEWLTTHWVLSLFNSRIKQATRAFDRFVGQRDADTYPFDEGTRNDPRLLGDDDFIASMLDTKGEVPTSESLDLIIERHCRRNLIDEEQLASPSRTRRNARIRAEIALEAMAEKVATVAQIARRFNRSEPVMIRSMNHYRYRTSSKSNKSIS